MLDIGAEGSDMLQVPLLMEGIVACLREQSIRALAAGVKRGDYRLTDLPLHVADLPTWPGGGRRKQ